MLEKLTRSELEEGIQVVCYNVLSLIEDAELLLSNDRFPRAFTLGQLANEEIGKAVILYHIHLHFDEHSTIDFKQLNSDFRDHKAKTFHATYPDFFNAATRRRGEPVKDRETYINEILEEIEKGEYQYNNLKNESLYVSVKKNKFLAPSEIIGKEVAEESIVKAKKRVNRFVHHINDYLFS